MTKKKSTKRALISSLLILAMCFTMLAGTTFAWFTDTVESGNNIIKSGKLDIDLEVLRSIPGATATDPATEEYVSIGTDASPIFNYELWEPGYTEWANVRVINKGNLALKYTMKISATGEVSELADVIDVYYAPVQIDKPATRPEKLDDIQGLTRIGTLREAINGTVVINDKLEATNAADYATIVLHMQESAGNEYQEKAIGSAFTFQILATQYTKEVDSFDDQYDAAATMPIVATTTSELVNAINTVEDGGTIVVDGDLSHYGFNINNGKEFTIDLNGNDIALLGLYGSSDVTVENGHVGFPGQQGISLNGDNNKLTVAEDAIVDGTWGVTMFGKNNEVNIYGTVNSNVFVSGNVHEGTSVVNIYGTINNAADGDVGVALNGHATVNVYDGASIKGETGIEVRAGNLNVYGGTIEGTGVPTEFTPNGNGTTTTGAGIAVSQHTTYLPINVNISGGTIKGYTALYEINSQGSTDEQLATIKINVTGGTFEAINGGSNKFAITDETKLGQCVLPA